VFFRLLGKEAHEFEADSRVGACARKRNRVSFALKSVAPAVKIKECTPVTRTTFDMFLLGGLN